MQPITFMLPMPEPRTADLPLSAAPAPASVPDGGSYALVARAIGLLQAQARRQPSLVAVATELGVGASTLQRAFSAQVGISPKRFLQFLTKEHARALLTASHDVLGATLDVGLSSPGRLHDLMIQCEAMTPGEVRRAGADVRLHWAEVDTPVGRALAARSDRGGLAFFGFIDADSGGLEASLADLRARWPRASLLPDDATADAVRRAFAQWRAGRPLHLLLAGTNLQLKVWEALLAIPAGRVVSYQQLADAVGEPRAVRAVASAVGRNPLSILIPCHRVIRGDGSLGGYHWGLPRKAALLAMESAGRSPLPG